MSWKVFDTGSRSAPENMELDAALLQDMQQECDCILHLYDWEKDAATYGCFVDPEKFFHLSALEDVGVDCAKRPTGGGILFHTCDLAFSVLVPASSPHFSQKPLDNYAFVNRHVIVAISKFLGITAQLLPQEESPTDPRLSRFCMAKPTKYDVMIEGRKVGGAAQRKTEHGFLHQGSISLTLPSETLLNTTLIEGDKVLSEMKKNSFTLLDPSISQKELQEARETLKELLRDVFVSGI